MALLLMSFNLFAKEAIVLTKLIHFLHFLQILYFHLYIFVLEGFDFLNELLALPFHFLHFVPKTNSLLREACYLLIQINE